MLTTMCDAPGLIPVKNNFRYPDSIKSFSLAEDNPVSQGSQIHTQHLSKWVMPSEPECEKKQNRQQEGQHGKEAPSLCCGLAVVLTFYADLQPLLLCS